MKHIYKAWLIQIEVTNACGIRCAHFPRAVRHFEKPYFADLDFIDRALASLEGWKRGVGCMGGEPTLHPEFQDICRLYRKRFPKEQCGLFTSGGQRYREYEALIRETFGIICYNDYTTTSIHQPIMAASADLIKDEKLRNSMMCWASWHARKGG